MPTYVVQCDKCGEVIEFTAKIAERDSMTGKVCPLCRDGHYVRVMVPVAFGDPVKMGMSGKRSDMKEILSRIHERTPGSQLDKTSKVNPI